MNLVIFFMDKLIIFFLTVMGMRFF